MQEIEVYYQIDSIVQKMGKKIIQKYSKLSTLLRYQFLKMIHREGSTIKQAAKKFGINYSSAKSIARENDDIFNEDDWGDEPIVDMNKMRRAQYKLIEQGKEKIEFSTDSSHKNRQIELNTVKPQRIMIVARVGLQYNDYKQQRF